MNEKIKVIQLVLDLGTGGVEKFVVDLALNLDKEKYDVTVVSLVSRKNSIFENILEKSGIKVVYLDMSMKHFDYSVIGKVNRLIKKEKPHVLHIHTYIMKAALFSILFNDIKVKIHTVHVPAQVEIKQCSKIVLKLAYKLGKVMPVAVSENVKSGIESCFKIEDVKLIYNGIDFKRFKAAKEKKDKESIKFINVARFMPEKNHEMLVKAFAKVCEKYSNVKLFLVGKGRLQEKIKNFVKELNIEDKVEFLGLREDIPELLNKSDIFLLTSDYEGFGLVLAEAMCCKVPVISTNAGAVSELVKDKENGILVPKGDIDAFAKSMIYLIENKALREEYAENALKSVKKFDLKYTISAYEKLYLEGVNSYNYGR